MENDLKKHFDSLKEYNNKKYEELITIFRDFSSKID